MMIRPRVSAFVLLVAAASVAEAQEAPPPGEQDEPPAERQPPAEPEPAAVAEPPVGEQSFEDEPVTRPAPLATPERTPEDIESFAEATMEAVQVSGGRLRFALNAFGDASFLAAAPVEGDESATFALGTLALLVNGQLGASLLATAEIAFDANRDNVQATKLERLHLRWQTPRYFVIGGRMHTDLGYWNTAFHHGAWLHLPIGRPRVMRGEGFGGILPIHWIGLEGGVVLPVADGKRLTVAGGIGNGRGHEERDIRLTTDSNDFKSLKLKVELHGLGWPELRIGGGGIYDRIAPASEAIRPALPDQEIDEVIGNLYLAHRGARLTIIAESFAIWHLADAERFTTADTYVVAGYRFGRVTPFIQLERTDALGPPDPFYTPVPDMPTLSTPVDQTELLLGTRIDASVWSAIKAEYGLLRIDDASGFDHRVAVNWSFGI
jgi:hypothetical protein